MHMSENANWKKLKATVTEVDSHRPGTRQPQRVPYPEFPKRQRLNATQRWQSLLWSIDTAEEHGKHALRGLTVALSRIILGQALDTLLLDAREFHKPALDPAALLWDEDLPLTASGQTMRDLTTRLPRSLSVDLNDAAVFPSPWERWRLHGALHNLGTGRAWGSWRQDRNDFGIAWKPWPLVWVSNGNHSTMAAVVRGGGRFKCHEALDFTPVLSAVRTDGISWYRVDNGEELGPVRSMPMAGIFEVGQRLSSR
jgi:hypothetical protein